MKINSIYKLKIKIINFFNLIFNSLKLNLHLDSTVSKKDILDLVSLMKVKNLGYKLIRVGAKNDGGYLVPDILDQIEYCFSPGVGKVYEFEKEIYQKKIPIFLADGSIEKDNIKIDSFDFVKKNISSFNGQNNLTLERWINLKLNKKNSNLILQMDIEGSEYEAINATSEEYLNLFKIMIIEFHFLEKIYNRLGYNTVKNCLSKIRESFEVAHIHPNNCLGFFYICGEKFPTALEITFLRKDLCKKINRIKELPNILDQKNIKDLPDIFLSNKWY